MVKGADRWFEEAVALVLRHEGGYVNDPRDPGGETRFGISKRTYPTLDIASLTEEQARDIYLLDWWRPNRYGEIDNSALAIKVFDIAVNVGAGRANKWLQGAARREGYDIRVDGVIGPRTLAAVNAAHPVRLMVRFLGDAEAHYRTLGARKPYYLDGWMRRLFNF